MDKLIIYFGLSAVLIAGSLASANTLSCRFQYDNGFATVTITAATPLLAWQEPYFGHMTVDIEGLELKPTFPVNLHPGDASSRFEIKNGELKLAKVMFNQGHQQVSIYPYADGTRIYMASPYGLFGSEPISQPCLK